METYGVGQGIQLYCWTGTDWIKVRADADGWLRVDTKHIPANFIRPTSTGLKVTGKCNLHWITLVPSATASVISLTDSLVAGAPQAWGFYRATRDSSHISFEPSLVFSTGLYVQTLTNISMVIIAYDTE